MLQAQSDPSFVDLETPPDLVNDLASLGISSPTQLALLAAISFESPSGTISVNGYWHHGASLLERFLHSLYRSYKVAQMPEVHSSADHRDGAVSYELSLSAPNFSLVSSMTVPESDVDAVLSGRSILDVVKFEGISTFSVPFDPSTDLRELLEILEPAEAAVLNARFRLEGDPPATLEQIGRRQGVTREWIRQLESRAIKRLRDIALSSEELHRRAKHLVSRGRGNDPHPKRAGKRRDLDRYSFGRSQQALTRLSRMVESYASRLVAPPDDPIVQRAIEQDFPGAPRPVSGWLRLLIEINGKTWAQPEESPLTGIERAVVSILARKGPMTSDSLAEQVAVSLSVPNDEVLATRIRASGACQLAPGGLWSLPPLPIPGIEDKRLRRLNSLIRVLERDGPSHFTRITEKVNAFLLPAYSMTTRDVHAWLERYQDYFVWAGPGTYGLRKQGVGIRSETGETELPVEYRRRRRKGIGDEIVLVLLERGALTVDAVAEHILPRFFVNRSSVEASILQDKAGRFTVTPDGLVHLRGTTDAQVRPVPKRIRITTDLVSEVMTGARKLRDQVHRAGLTRYVRLDGASLFNHVAVAAVLGLHDEWSALETAPGRPTIPPAAWATADAIRRQSGII